MVAVVLGIDIGANGAIAILTISGELLNVVDMPSLPEANGRRATNAALLSNIIAESNADRIFCEFVAARPTDAKVAAFAFGRARGVIEGIAGAFDLPIVWITPPVWKRFAGVPPGKENKDVARSRAIARWPKHAQRFARKTDIDRAEACLIGAAGLARAGLEVAA
jgi:crossover junction endodeoxyribonuclease RuvC